MAGRKLIRTSYEHRRKSLATMASVDGHQSRPSLAEAGGRRFSVAAFPDDDLASFSRSGSESSLGAGTAGPGGITPQELHQKLIRRSYQQRPSPKREKPHLHSSHSFSNSSSSGKREANLTWTLIGVLVLIALLFIMVVVVSKSLLKYLKGK